MSYYVKKPIVIEAVQLLTPNLWENKERNKMLIRAYEYGQIILLNDGALIKTLEGDMKANLGDWIIKGVNGEYYPCKPNIFNATYDFVE